MFKILIFIALFFMHISSAQPLEINLLEKYETKDYVQYTIAQEINETVDNLKNRTWSKNTKKLNSVEHSNKPYWVKLPIKNITNLGQTYYLKSENQFTYKVDYYLVKDKKVLTHIEDGVTAKNGNRSFNTNHMIFSLFIPANTQLEVYFKIRNYNKINLDFTMVTKDYLVDYYQSYNMLEGIFFGGMLLMMLYNLFLYFLLHIRAYIYYVGYVLSLSIYFIGLFGFSQRYFESCTYIFYFSSGAFFIFLTLFVQSILNLNEKLPKINKLLNLFIVYFAITTLTNVYILEAELFIYAQSLFNIFFILVPIYVLIIIGSTYYLAYYKKDIIARFYSITWSVMASIGLLLPLQYLNIIHISIPSDYLFQFLILIEALLFSFILAFKINLIEHEKKEQERILVQQNKLASMGEVISMIAHQWRQPLSEVNGIILNMDIDYQKKALPQKKFNAYLDNLEMTTAYMSETINTFLDYFKHNKEAEEFNFTTLIEGTLNLIPSTSKNDVNIKYDRESEIILLTHKSELIQALLIVINNSIDACHEENIKNIIISTKIIDSNIVISVQDNGIGIPNDIIHKIYDPYFTTKHKSKGVGLGLYILKMIIEENMLGKVELNKSQGDTICNLYIPNIVIK